ncbi:4'-phosphopantetheinyl transferase superfamily protein [Flavobacterium sp.]|uniref:4'-phosphopantetheinyl transferase family protein n=1 Tax=Flavobacterium sp. TaxID=239 RepID=UPI0037523F8A
MIGNDIVDLALSQIESNWKRKGFIDKIFTVQEQSAINSSENQEIMIWNLWSRKEAAYKIYNRQTGIRNYNPIQFECSDLDLEIGKVVFDNKVFFTKTEITSDYIYTESVVKIIDFDKIKTIARPENIQKEEGIPYYFDVLDLVNKPLSITHHGRFERIISI